MKRRTFIQTLLGSLAAVGLGKKLIDSENQGLVTKIAGNNGPRGCKGKFNGIWVGKYDQNMEPIQFVFVDRVKLKWLKRHYQAKLKEGFGPIKTDDGLITIWQIDHYLKVPIQYLT